MSINAKTVVRCIIAGEWIWVERGTFTVMPLEFVDDDGNVLAPSSEWGYFFTSTQGDPYFGPLSAISLMKLDSQLLEETGSGPRQRGRPAEIGPGDPDAPIRTGGSGLFEDEAGVARSESPGAEEAPDEDHEPVAAPKKSVPLFADDIDEDLGDEPRRRGGLF